MKKRMERGAISVVIVIAVCALLILFMENKSQDVAGTKEPKVSTDLYVNDAAKETVMEEEQNSLWVLFDHLAFERDEDYIGIMAFCGILIFYIVLIGPVIYFVLKKRDKMEWMWMVIPSVALLFTVGIMGFRGELVVSEPILDSVTVISPEAENAVEYLSVVSPGKESYRISFDDGVENVMPLYISGEEELAYGDSMTRGTNYSIYENEKVFLEVTPEYAFSDGYFRVDLNREEEGVIECTIREEKDAYAGTLKNATQWDFSYIFLYADGKHCLFANVKQDALVKYDSQNWNWKDKEDKKEEGFFGGVDSDVRKLIGLGYQKYFVEGAPEELKVLGIISDYKSSVKSEDLDCISYGLFYQTFRMPE